MVHLARIFHQTKRFCKEFCVTLLNLAHLMGLACCSAQNYQNSNDAKNWAANQLGHTKQRIYDDSGKWIGWQNDNGDRVFWGHGDWGGGLGLSDSPHLNYEIGNKKGHLFLNVAYHDPIIRFPKLFIIRFGHFMMGLPRCDYNKKAVDLFSVDLSSSLPS